MDVYSDPLVLVYARTNRQRESFAEVAMCYVFIADIVLSYLNKIQCPAVDHVDEEALHDVSEFLRTSSLQAKFKDAEEDSYQHPMFENDGNGFVKSMSKAAKYAEKVALLGIMQYAWQMHESHVLGDDGIG